MVLLQRNVATICRINLVLVKKTIPSIWEKIIHKVILENTISIPIQTVLIQKSNYKIS